jgi:hypothetical protein
VTSKIQKLRVMRPEALSLVFVLATTATWVLATPGSLDRFGTLKGTDFSQFYVAARLVATGQADQLYDWSVFAHALSTWVPGPEGLLYLSVYPPVLAVLLSPLGWAPYLTALAVWTAISAAIYIVSGAMLIRHTPALREDSISSYLLLISFPAFSQLLLFGQVSAVLLLLVTLSWLAWRNGQPLVAGLALGALVLKPQMVAIGAAATLLLRNWRLVVGIACGAALELAGTAVVVGPGVIRNYVGAVERILRNPAAFEPKAEQIQSLRGFLTPIIGYGTATTVVSLIGSIAVLVVASRAIRRIESSDLRFAVVVLAGALINPHLYVYDLVVLIVPLGLIAGWVVEESLAGRRHFGTGVGVRLLYWIPLVAPIAGALRLQLTAPTMVSLLWTLGSDARARPTDGP